jgi:uncharacterized protein YaaN involved in tellurite resistance
VANMSADPAKALLEACDGRMKRPVIQAVRMARALRIVVEALEKIRNAQQEWTMERAVAQEALARAAEEVQE